MYYFWIVENFQGSTGKRVFQTQFKEDAQKAFGFGEPDMTVEDDLMNGYEVVLKDDVLTKVKKEDREKQAQVENETQAEIDELLNKLKELDYIGVKIATGRATVEEYSEEIELMKEYSARLNELGYKEVV